MNILKHFHMVKQTRFYCHMFQVM